MAIHQICRDFATESQSDLYDTLPKPEFLFVTFPSLKLILYKLS